MSQRTRDAERRPRSRLPRVGEMAPPLRLPTTDRTTIDLATTPKPVALVFLRHLLCLH